MDKLATGPGGAALDNTGQVQFAPAAADTAIAGSFFVEWEVTFTSGVVQTWLQNDNIIWVITADLI